jgi:hypothetical protein
MQTNQIFDVQKLSPHLFWDVDRTKLDADTNKKLIINRVLDYGILNDWYYIQNFYSIQEIAQISVTIKDLDLKSMAFVSLLANVPKENFLCYTTTQLHPKHWNF